MSSVKVKICGLKRAEDIAYANELKPDYIGFLFVPGRARTVTISQARELKQKLSPAITAVGVFLDQEIDEILETVLADTIDMIQLHGHEDDHYIAVLRKRLETLNRPLPIIKAGSVRNRNDIDEAVKTSADLLLLDNKIPGSGTTFDWNLLTGVGRPFFLAGGLSPANIEAALEVHPYGVDVSSGVESDGVKNYEKMKVLITAVRNSTC